MSGSGRVDLKAILAIQAGCRDVLGDLAPRGMKPGEFIISRHFSQATADKCGRAQLAALRLFAAMDAVRGAPRVTPPDDPEDPTQAGLLAAVLPQIRSDAAALGAYLPERQAAQLMADVEQLAGELDAAEAPTAAKPAGRTVRWTPELKEDARAMRARLDAEGVKAPMQQTAAHFGVKPQRMRVVLGPDSTKEPLKTLQGWPPPRTAKKRAR